MYRIGRSHIKIEVGSLPGFQVEALLDANGYQLSVTKGMSAPIVTAKLAKNCKLTSYLSHPYGSHYLILHDELLNMCNEILAPISLEARKLELVNPDYGTYWLCQTPEITMEQLDPDNTLIGRFRRNPVTNPKTIYRHIPDGALEVLPIQLAHLTADPPPGGWVGRIIWLSVKVAEAVPELSLFRIRGLKFCSEEFYTRYMDGGYTGLQFRPLIASPAQWKGETFIMWVPEYFM